MKDNFRNMLDRFRTHLLGIPITENYAERMTLALERSWSDPLGYLSSIRLAQSFKTTRNAWKHWCDWTNQEEPARSMFKMRVPRSLPPKERIVPNDDQLRSAAESAAGLSLPAGPLLWILYLSGLRIAEVCGIERLEAEQAVSLPEIKIRAKGPGFWRRTWVPGALVRPALAALLTRPWRSTWVLLASSKVTAAQILREKAGKFSGGFHPHDFRHSVARLLRRLGYQDSVISAVLGHDLRPIMGTTAIYAKPAPEELEQAHASIAWHLWPNGYSPPAGSWLLGGGFPGGSGGVARGDLAAGGTGAVRS